MRPYLILLSILLFFSNSTLIEQLEFLKKEVLEEHENILKFWENNTLDEVNGGFIGQIYSNMTKNLEADKGVIVNARITWAYSAAYIYTGNYEYLKLATRAYNYLLTKFYNHEDNGVFFMIDYNGKLKDDRNLVIAVAFVTYAFSEYYRATKNEQALDYALKLFNSLENNAYDKDNKGYFETFSKKWEKLKDMRMYPGDPDAKKTMNANFHLMVAYANIYREYKDENVEKALKGLIEVLMEKIIDKERGSCKLYFNENWEAISTDDNYGLDIEASWLLLDAAQVLGDEDLIKVIQDIAIKIVDHCLKYGYDIDGGMMNGGNDKEGATNKDKSWWTQAESVIAFINAYQINKDRKYLAKALLTWDFIKKYVIDHKDGEWYGTVGKDDHKPNFNEDKAGPWKCPYHNSRMGLQVAERVDKIIKELKNENSDN